MSECTHTHVCTHKCVCISFITRAHTDICAHTHAGAFQVGCHANNCIIRLRVCNRNMCSGTLLTAFDLLSLSHT
jgi:hypothetical protein